MSDFDIVVVGGGPGGYAAALYAASAGQKVAMVEKRTVGGTCLHRGCIPAKALLHAAEVFRTVGHAADFGITLGDGAGPSADWPGINKRKSGIVSTLHKGLSGCSSAARSRLSTAWAPSPRPARYRLTVRRSPARP